MSQLPSISRRSGRARATPFHRVAFAGLVAGAALFASAYLVAAATAPSLGAAESYAVLAGTTVTNNGPTTITGDLGVSPGSAVTGFPPGIVNLPGTIHAADTNAAAAQLASAAAFTSLAAQGCTLTYTGIKDLVGENLVPGVYCADAFTLTGTFTLQGSGVWIFKSASTLITSGTANIVGGNPCNVWWRVVSSATFGTNTSLIGNVLASTSIAMATGATLNGRALAQTGAVTMDRNTVSNAICAAAPNPTASPTASPSATPTASPSATPTASPSATPTASPSATPTASPSATPTASPSATPTASPTPAATPRPSAPSPPPTTTDPAPPQGGTDILFVLLGALIAGGLALDFGARAYRRRAQ